ncbi:hypothetical protein [Engelhardtia mirabilis]|uniref:HTH cro/C1-type domain-containing protein n=1 Tax=Engelhardtia mirabilis TaxID=2528011 RepID=A0A518BT49_9BACT|nr:hypothetical protein Pla133_52580 [Planctomycetes bacterium Pla133]QDV04461.1 hypothetical protein Pla86_52560 [Planctomycetes bacterium Pla86]
MKKNNAELVAKARAMSVAFRESILEASEGELRQALQNEGLDLDEEAARAQDVIEKAFEKAGVHLPAPANEGPEHLGELLLLLRRKKKLTEAKLALQAGVPVEDVLRTESDPTFVPSLRTLARLEDFFKLKDRTLSILAGAVRVQKDAAEFREGVEQFKWAAFSRGMGKLSREEKKQLDQIIRFLGDYTE